MRPWWNSSASGSRVHGRPRPAHARGSRRVSPSRRRRPRRRRRPAGARSPRRQRTRSVPPSFTGMTTEINGVSYSTSVAGRAAQRHGEQREEERAEHDLDAEPERRSRAGRSRRRDRARRSPLRPTPRPTATRPTTANSDERAPDDQAVLEAEVAAEPLEQRVALADPHARVRPCEDAELDDLRADQRHRDEPEHRVDLPRVAEDVDRAGGEDDHADEPEQEQDARRARGRASSGCTGA